MNQSLQDPESFLRIGYATNERTVCVGVKRDRRRTPCTQSVRLSGGRNSPVGLDFQGILCAMSFIHGTVQSSQVYRLAQDCLCSYHKGQAYEIAQGWSNTINNETLKRHNLLRECDPWSAYLSDMDTAAQHGSGRLWNGKLELETSQRTIRFLRRKNKFLELDVTKLKDDRHATFRCVEEAKVQNNLLCTEVESWKQKFKALEHEIKEEKKLAAQFAAKAKKDVEDGQVRISALEQTLKEAQLERAAQDVNIADLRVSEEKLKATVLQSITDLQALRIETNATQDKLLRNLYAEMGEPVKAETSPSEDLEKERLDLNRSKESSPNMTVEVKEESQS